MIGQQILGTAKRWIGSSLSMPMLQKNSNNMQLDKIIRGTRYATWRQVLKGARKSKSSEKISVSKDLEQCPQKKGVVVKVLVVKPKKPNSANRKAVRVRLSNGSYVSAYIPGEGHNAQEHSLILVRGGRVKDCPGIKYHAIRGALDLGGVVGRATSRSKYGTKKPT